jgi:hypothetical protein
MSDRVVHCFLLEGQRATSTGGVNVTCTTVQDAVYRVDRRNPEWQRSEREFVICFSFLILAS